MILSISQDGTTTAVYTEAIDLERLGRVSITKHVSHVEPDDFGHWWADLSPINGPKLGPFHRRSECVAAEVAYIEQNVL